MNALSNIKLNYLTLIGIAAMYTALMSSAAGAQSIESDAVKEKLSTKVHLRLGRTTLGKVASELSEQTGLTIEPADYLMDRDMIAQMDGMSARAILNALMELNDWKWREMPDHTISIVRHILRPPQIPAAIPRIIQSAIPKDTRAFLTMAAPNDDLNVYSNPDLADAIDVNNRLHKAPRLMRDKQADLFRNMPPDAVKGDPIPFGKLSDSQQRNLAAYFSFTLLTSLDKLLLSDFHPFVYDPARTRIKTDGAILWFEYPKGDSWSGFGITYPANAGIR